MVNAAVEVIQLDLTALNFLGGVFIPLLVAVLTRSSASRGLKAVLNALLSLAAGLVATAIATDGLLEMQTVVSVGITWVTSVATYYGLLKPSGVAPLLADATKNFGLGTASSSSGDPPNARSGP